MGFSGDIGAIERLGQRFAELATVPSRAAREASEDIQTLIDDEYSHGADPYGSAWAPLRPSTLATGRTPPPLTASSDMRDGTEVHPMSGAGIDVSIDEPYWVFHQTGTARMAARPILPDGTELPPSWVSAIAGACDAAVKRSLGAR